MQNGQGVTWWERSAARLLNLKAQGQAYPQSETEGGVGEGWLGWAGEGEEPDLAHLEPALSVSSSIGQLGCSSGARLHR